MINIIDWDLETKYYEIVRSVASLQRDYPNLDLLVIDETGVGKGVKEIFEKELTKEWRNLEVIGFDFAGPKKKKELVESAIADLESNKVEIIYNYNLISEMLEFKREITPHGNIKYQKPNGGSDDYVDSLLLTLYGARIIYDDIETDDEIPAQITGFKTIKTYIDAPRNQTHLKHIKRGIL